ncbi:hypothetical protein MTsPCn5_17230 [Croceitalea sp. MTPC5]|uniref:hypothetical protein n=1 Tax=Croceitalea sp. MTPC5 TaxID=3056565 RepID=UPI002B370BB0|nr:hypothetical protein MTsPCn5_17230 [Croceitalea sp. MTPC5]
MDNNDFFTLFTPDSEALKIGLILRDLLFSSFSDIEETISGGAKVKLALYSRGGKNNVLCGIQQSKDGSCMLYVHHIDSISHERLKFSGSGKHAKRIKFSDASQILADDIIWLFQLVEKNAPY